MDPASPQTSPPGPPPIASTAPERLRPLDAWHVARDAIKHEDALTNHRLTWLLLLHGFLFAGMGAVLQGVATRGVFDGLLFLVALVISLVGLFSPGFVWITLDAAVSHVHRVTKWWEEEYGGPNPKAASGSHLQMFPPVRGHKYDRQRFRLLEHLARPIQLPWLLMTAWLVIGAATVIAYATTARPQPERQHEETITIPSADPTRPITITRADKP